MSTQNQDQPPVPAVGLDIQGEPVSKADEKVVDVNKIVPGDVTVPVQEGETGLEPIVEKDVVITDDTTDKTHD